MYTMIKKNMIYKLYAMIFIVIFSMQMNGCCNQVSRVDPELPKDIKLGWRKNIEDLHSESVYKSYFVLKINESIDNGKIRITLIDLIAPETRFICNEHNRYPDRPRGVIKFTRVSDNQALEEKNMDEDSGINLQNNKNIANDNADYGISSVVMSSINLKEGWALINIYQSK